MGLEFSYIFEYVLGEGGDGDTWVSWILRSAFLSNRTINWINIVKVLDQSVKLGKNKVLYHTFNCLYLLFVVYPCNYLSINKA